MKCAFICIKICCGTDDRRPQKIWQVHEAYQDPEFNQPKFQKGAKGIGPRLRSVPFFLRLVKGHPLTFSWFRMQQLSFLVDSVTSPKSLLFSTGSLYILELTFKACLGPCFLTEILAPNEPVCSLSFTAGLSWPSHIFG